MGLVAALSRRGGIMRVRTARAMGIGEREITRAVDSGVVVRPRKGWIAVADVDPALRTAAEAGVVITCVSQAQRLGLWILESDRWHVAAPAHGKLLRSVRAHVHWAAPVVPRNPDELTDPIENVLAIVASCQPYEHALAIWESAMRRELIDVMAMSRLALGQDARRVLADALPFADSGSETIVVPRLRWLKVTMRRQVTIAGHRVDLLIGDRLVLQIDGGHHIGPQRDSDNAHDALLALMGYHVIRVSLRQIMNDWAAVHDLIVRAVAQGLHLAAD